MLRERTNRASEDEQSLRRRCQMRRYIECKCHQHIAIVSVCTSKHRAQTIDCGSHDAGGTGLSYHIFTLPIFQFNLLSETISLLASRDEREPSSRCERTVFDLIRENIQTRCQYGYEIILCHIST